MAEEKKENLWTRGVKKGKEVLGKAKDTFVENNKQALNTLKDAGKTVVEKAPEVAKKTAKMMNPMETIKTTGSYLVENKTNKALGADSKPWEETKTVDETLTETETPKEEEIGTNISLNEKEPEVPKVEPAEAPKGKMPNKEIGETGDDTTSFTEANNAITETLGEEGGADFVNTATEAMAEAGVPTTDSKEEIETGKDALDNQLSEEGFVHQSVDANGNRVTTRLTPEEFAELSKDLNRKEKLGKILTGISFAITALTGGRIMPINFRQMLEPTDDEVAAYNDYTKAIDQLKAADDEYNKTKSTGDAEAVNTKTKAKAEAEAKYAGVDEYNKRVADLAEQYSDEDVEVYAQEHNMSPDEARTAMAKDALHTSGYEVGKLENELSGKSEAGDDEFNKLLKMSDKELENKLKEMQQQLVNDGKLNEQNAKIQERLSQKLHDLQAKQGVDIIKAYQDRFGNINADTIATLQQLANGQASSMRELELGVLKNLANLVK